MCFAYSKFCILFAYRTGVMNNQNLQPYTLQPVKLPFKVSAWFFELLSGRKESVIFSSRNWYLDRASLVRCSSSSCSSPSLQQERSKHVSSRKDLISSSFSEITRYLQSQKKKKKSAQACREVSTSPSIISTMHSFLLSTYVKIERNYPAALSTSLCAAEFPVFYLNHCHGFDLMQNIGTNKTSTCKYCF